MAVKTGTQALGLRTELIIKLKVQSSKLKVKREMVKGDSPDLCIISVQTLSSVSCKRCPHGDGG
jgi:hypothetical protein